jgi:hypothetical protein
MNLMTDEPDELEWRRSGWESRVRAAGAESDPERCPPTHGSPVICQWGQSGVLSDPGAVETGLNAVRSLGLRQAVVGCTDPSAACSCGSGEAGWQERNAVTLGITISRYRRLWDRRSLLSGRFHRAVLALVGSSRKDGPTYSPRVHGSVPAS